MIVLILFAIFTIVFFGYLGFVYGPDLLWAALEAMDDWKALGQKIRDRRSNHD